MSLVRPCTDCVSPLHLSQGHKGPVTALAIQQLHPCEQQQQQQPQSHQHPQQPPPAFLLVSVGGDSEVCVCVRVCVRACVRACV